MDFIKRLLTWWGRETIGTQLYTWRKGQLVGEDAEGNRYYQTRDGKRRWVIFNGTPEATRVTPEWHGWLHATFVDPPTKTPLKHKPWEQPHQVNPTGTDMAYVPAGSIRAARPVERSDYDAWQPE